MAILCGAAKNSLRGTAPIIWCQYACGKFTAGVVDTGGAL